MQRYKMTNTAREKKTHARTCTRAYTYTHAVAAPGFDLRAGAWTLSTGGGGVKVKQTDIFILTSVCTCFCDFECV